MRSRGIAVTVVVSCILSIGSPLSAKSPSPGSKCRKLGSSATTARGNLICKRVKGRLVWRLNKSKSAGQGAGNSTTTIPTGNSVARAQEASRKLNGDERECVIDAVGRSISDDASNGRGLASNAEKFLVAVGACSGGNALPCAETNSTSPVQMANRSLPNVVTYQTSGLSSLLRPLPENTPPGARNGFILADPTTGVLPDGSLMLAFTGAQTAVGTTTGREERSPHRKFTIPKLTGNESSISATATDVTYSLPNSYQSASGLGVVGWWQIVSGTGFTPVLLGLGPTTSAPIEQSNNAIHAWRAQNSELTEWSYLGQLISARNLRGSAGGSFAATGFADARITSITFVQVSGSTFRIYSGLESGDGRSKGVASMVIDAAGSGLPSLTVDAGRRAAAIEEAHVVALIGPGGRTLGYAMGVGRGTESSCMALSTDGLTFGDPISGGGHSSMTLISTTTSENSVRTTWLALGTKSGPSTTDGITARWLDITVRAAPSTPRYKIGD